MVAISDTLAQMNVVIRAISDMLCNVYKNQLERMSPAPQATQDRPQAPAPTQEAAFDFDKLKTIEGGIFDYLYPLIKTPRNVMDAFDLGFAGCPPINCMESRESDYARVWRAGGKRYKTFCELRVVNDDIEKQPGKDRHMHTLSMRMKYTGNVARALSTLAKAISKKANTKWVDICVLFCLDPGILGSRILHPI